MRGRLRSRTRIDRPAKRRRVRLEALENRRLLSTVIGINELMYNPAGTSEDLEWIELHNPNAVDLDLSGWSIDGGVRYRFAQGTSIEGKGYLVVAASPQRLAAETGFADALGPFSGNLNNEGDALRVLNNNGRLVEQLEYEDGGSWPPEADGSGATLASLLEVSPPDITANWTFSAQLGGTPGTTNFPAEDQRPRRFDSLVTPGTDARVLVPQTAAELPADWNDPAFDDQDAPDWFDATIGIGFDRRGSSAVGDLIDAAGDIGDRMHQVNSSSFARIPFEVSDADAYDSLGLDVAYDDGFVAYLNGQEIARRGVSPGSPSWNESATDEPELGYSLRIADVARDGANAPVGYWRLNEPIGAQKAANSGSAGDALHATYLDFGDTGDGLFDTAAGLVGENDSAIDLQAFGHVLGGGLDSLPAGNPFEGDWTIEAWFQRDTGDPGSALLSNAVAGNGPALGFLDDAFGESNRLGISGVPATSSNVSVDLGDDHFGRPVYAVITKTGGNGLGEAQLTVYANVDGRWLAPASGTNSTWALNPQDGFMIGRHWGGDYSLFDGTIDEVAVYDRALTAEQVEAHFLFSGRDQDSSLTGTPPPTESFALESIDISAHLPLLTDGPNLLAIQGVNFSVQDTDFLLRPTVSARRVPSAPSPQRNLVFDEVSSAGDASFWIELRNLGDETVDLDGVSLRSSDGGAPGFVLGATELEPGERLVIDETELGFRPDDGDKLFLFTTDHDSVIDAVQVTDRLRGRSDEMDGAWLYPDTATPGQPNSFRFHDEIVINEILYHFRPDSPTPLTPATYESSVLMPMDTRWRFSDTNFDFGPDWAAEPHFIADDPVNWSSGRALIGFESANLGEPIRTTLSDPLLNTPYVTTYYFEAEFLFDGDPDDDLDLLARFLIDDGAVIYLNGQEALRINMPDGPIEHDTEALIPQGNAASEGPIVIDKSGLVNGVNRLSVEVHQGSTVSSDVVFGVELSMREVVVPSIPGDPYFQSDEEWIELHNRSDQTVDLSAWRVAGGIDYRFDDGVTIAAGGYLVVAKDSQALGAKYPGIEVVGDFSGSLNNHSDTIRLLDAADNPADEVTYFEQGRWPEWADGGGSSLELRDPDADNSLPEAWAASDEQEKSEWRTFTYRQVAEPDVGPNPVIAWNELALGMLDSGEVLIDDVRFVEDPDGAALQLIQNGSFESDAAGQTPARWRIIGNHQGTVVQDPTDPNNQVLRLTAFGPTEHQHNHAETTFVDNREIQDGATYEFSYRAKWVGGSSLLNSRANLVRVARSIPLAVPEHNGTPGRVNSTREANIGPTFEQFGHSPVVPDPFETITVTARAADPDGVNSLTLWWNNDGGIFNPTAMTPQGDGTYVGQIPGRTPAAVVQFYVEARDAAGAVATFPPAGRDSRALIRVRDGSTGLPGMDTVQIIMLSGDTDRMFTNVNLMSNRSNGATVVHNGTEVFYDVGARLKGSPVGRSDPTRNGSYNVRFDPMQPFRGELEKISLDGSGRSGLLLNKQDEILVNALINHAGGMVGLYDDLVYLVSPRGSQNGPVILQQTLYDTPQFLNRFENGSDGSVYEQEVIHYAGSTVDGDPEGLKNPTDIQAGPPRDIAYRGPDKEDYRWTLMLENNRARDDYDQVIELSAAFSLSGEQLDEAVDAITDVDLWMRTYAMVSLSGNWDIYGVRPMHNIMLYVRPEDDKVMVLPWDQDFVFFASTDAPLYDPLNLNTNLTKLIERPANSRVFLGHLLDLMNTTFNQQYFAPVALRLADVAGQDYSQHINYVEQRSAYVRSVLPAPIDFEISTNDGMDFETDQQIVTLRGEGWIDVRRIRLAGGEAPLDVRWIDFDTWQIELPLAPGANALQLEAYDHQDRLVGADTITITGPAGGATLLDALRITEVMYHPHDPPAGSQHDDNDFEYVELTNVTAQPINLVGARFIDGIEFTFGDHVLDPGGFVVIVSNEAAFRSRYGDSATVAGTFGGALNNAGEMLHLVDGQGTTILAFEYDDSGSWPGRADGDASSLEIVDAADDYDDSENWRASTDYGGSPGTAGLGDFRDVVVNETLSHTDPPQLDSIELFNTTNQDIDLGGWFLSDSGANYLKYQIPPGTILPGRGYLVFSEAQFNPTPEMPGPNHFALNGARGDDVTLLATDPQGVPLRFADRATFGAQANGESWGRWPDGDGDFYPMTTLTLGQENSAPRVGPLIISEVMYHAEDPDGEGGVDPSDLEFVEIHNPTDQPVHLAGWRLGEAVEYAFETGVFLDPNQVLVVLPFEPRDPFNAERLLSFRQFHGIDESVALVGGFDGNLDNAGERLRLYRPDVPPIDEPNFTPLLLEDEVRYDDLAPWPTSADGMGDSLTRIDTELWGNDPNSWRGSAPTPGSVNFGPAPPTVLSVRLNESIPDPPDLPRGTQPTSWTTQRADWRTIDIRFSQDVSLTVEDLRLINLGIDATADDDVPVTLTADQLELDGDRLTIHLTDDLADGVYRLEILPSVTSVGGAPLDGDGDGIGGDAFVHQGDTDNTFFKLLSDWNADAGVSIFDFAVFAYWFGQSIPIAPEYVNLNDDDGISIFDFTVFAADFGRSVTFPPPGLIATGAVRNAVPIDLGATDRTENQHEPNADPRRDADVLAANAIVRDAPLTFRPATRRDRPDAPRTERAEHAHDVALEELLRRDEVAGS